MPYPPDMNGPQREVLHTALCSAYPLVTDFVQFVNFKLDIDSAEIKGSSLLDIVYFLIVKLGGKTKLPVLVAAAQADRPDNPRITDLPRALSVAPHRADPPSVFKDLTDLSGLQRKMIRETLAKVFPAKNELTRFADFKLDFPLLQFSTDDLGADIVCLVDNMGSAGKIKRLLDEAIYLKPDNTQLKALSGTLETAGSPERVQDATQSAAASAKEGLIALRRLMNVPTASKGTARFAGNFKAAAGNIKNMTTCKRVHDALHKIQVGVIEKIEMPISKYEKSNDASDMLFISAFVDDYQLCLEAFANLKESAGAASVDITWLAKDLEPAAADLKKGIDQKNIKLIKDAVKRVKRVMMFQPQRINDQLVHYAVDLNLNRLVQDLEILRDAFVKLNLEAAGVNAFKEGIVSLAGMDQQLGHMIEEHRMWQGYDIELRGIDADFVQSESYANSWAELYRFVMDYGVNARLSADHPLMAAVTRLNHAINVHVFEDVENALSRFIAMFIREFYKVDGHLLALCGLFDPIVQPLNAIIQQIPDTGIQST